MSFRSLGIHNEFRLLEDDRVLVKLGDRQAMTVSGKKIFVHPEEIVRK